VQNCSRSATGALHCGCSPLLSADEAEKFDEEAARASFKSVFMKFIKRFPGEAWSRTWQFAEREKMPELAES
jgi:hypothetical protein